MKWQLVQSGSVMVCPWRVKCSPLLIRPFLFRLDQDKPGIHHTLDRV